MDDRVDTGSPMQVGGQAVIEGVMMRAPGMVATAVRKGDGSVVLHRTPYRSLTERYRLLRVPIVRGAIGLVEMMVIGVSTLNFSAEVALQGESAKDVGTRGGGNGASHSSPGTGSDKLRLTVTVAVSFLVGLGLFFVTPLFVTSLLFSVEQDPLWFNLIAGGIRMGLFLGYLIAISRMKDVRRLFEYHGAEHKAVFAFERGEQLTVEAAARQSRFHPRCGTSFLLIVLLAAIMSFAILDALLILRLGRLTVWTRVLTHLPLIPVVGGLSYEFIRASAKRCHTRLGRMIVAPGLWLQRITTREPDASQLEVALVALRSALGKERAPAVPDALPIPNPVSAH